MCEQVMANRHNNSLRNWSLSSGTGREKSETRNPKFEFSTAASAPRVYFDLRLQRFFQPPPPPKRISKENRSARVHPRGIAELISAPCVVLGINFHIPSHQQARHGHRHQRSLQHPL